MSNELLMNKVIAVDIEKMYSKIKCCNCGCPCKTVEETFDYAGTHCNNGNSGTHHTGVYVSDCCFDDVEEITDNEQGE